MSANDSTQLPQRNGFVNVNWMVIAGGFAGGILCGAIALWTIGNIQTESGAATQVAAQKPSDETAHAVSNPSQSLHEDHDSSKLQQQVAELKQELEAERLRNEVARLRNEVTTLKRGTNEQPSRRKQRPEQFDPHTNAGADETTSPAATSAGELTLKFWNSLNEIIVREASMRSAPLSGLTAANAGDFLNRRVDAGKFASSAIRKLDRNGVDAEVVALGEKLAHWYEDNASVAGSGGNLLGADAESRQGQPGKKYQSSERGLQQSVAALNREGEQVREKMSRKYGLEFPKLQ